MGAPNLDLTRLYFGDYVGDTLDLTADQHVIFQKILLQLWLKRPGALNAGWLRKQSGLSRSNWRTIHPLLVLPLEIAFAGVQRWNEAIKAYDGQRLPTFDWQILRTIVFARDGHTCVYCGSTENLHLDHRISIARGGSNGLENLATACGACNCSKGAKTLDSWQDARRSTSARSKSKHVRKRHASSVSEITPTHDNDPFSRSCPKNFD